MAEQYTHTNSKGVTYHLNTKVVNLKGGRQQSIYYFTKDAGRPEACPLPEDREVAENPRNGFLVIKRKVS